MLRKPYTPFWEIYKFTSHENDSRILRIKNEFSEYGFYVSMNILGNFQIWISVPLTLQDYYPFDKKATGRNINIWLK